MNEKDLVDARTLLAIKKDIKWALEFYRREEKADIKLEHTVIVVRTSVLKELLDKELNYVNRRLKSLGVTELT